MCDVSVCLSVCAFLEQPSCTLLRCGTAIELLCPQASSGPSSEEWMVARYVCTSPLPHCMHSADVWSTTLLLALLAPGQNGASFRYQCTALATCTRSSGLGMSQRSDAPHPSA